MPNITGVVGTDTVTVSTTPVSLPNPIPGSNMKPMGGWLTVNTESIRHNGGDVDMDITTEGHLMTPTSPPYGLFGWGQVKNFRMVRGAGADASVTYTLGSDASP
jgi:hypothetical protein